MKDKAVLELLASYMREQGKCYDALLIKLEEQKKAIVRTDDARLKAIIEEKGDLIAVTHKLEEKVGGVLKALSEGERNRAIEETALLRGQLENSLKRLIALETACEDILNIEKIHTHNLIKELQQKKNVVKGYGKPNDDFGFSKKA